MIANNIPKVNKQLLEKVKFSFFLFFGMASKWPIMIPKHIPNMAKQFWKNMISDFFRSYVIITYHILSYHTISYHMIWYHIISYDITSYNIISYAIISYDIISYDIISYDIISYHIIWYHMIAAASPRLRPKKRMENRTVFGKIDFEKWHYQKKYINKIL